MSDDEMEFEDNFDSLNNRNSDEEENRLITKNTKTNRKELNKG